MDQLRQGDETLVAKTNNNHTCPVAMLEHYIQCTSIPLLLLLLFDCFTELKAIDSYYSTIRPELT